MLCPSTYMIQGEKAQEGFNKWTKVKLYFKMTTTLQFFLAFTIYRTDVTVFWKCRYSSNENLSWEPQVQNKRFSFENRPCHFQRLCSFKCTLKIKCILFRRNLGFPNIFVPTVKCLKRSPGTSFTSWSAGGGLILKSPESFLLPSMLNN